jgi:hypothetical protein
VRTELIITDLTRMYEGRICIAGYDRQWNCVRPVVRAGIPKGFLHINGQPVVFPFAIIGLNLLEHERNKPHTEDWDFSIFSVQLVRNLPEEQQERFLDRLTFDCVADIFDQPIHADPGFYVEDGQGSRSLGTIQVKEVEWVRYSPEDGGKYRISFMDQSGDRYRLAVTDLCWWSYHNIEIEHGYSSDERARHLQDYLQSTTVYLRIGLARGWHKFPGRCFLQITGVYAFPPYFEDPLTYYDLIAMYVRT